MSMILLTESLNYLDMEEQLLPLLGIDEYKPRLGDDKDVITLHFIVKEKEVGDDLVTWLERGYDFILDAETSPGQVETGKYYVFAEMNRRPSAPRKIMEIIEDLETLTGIKADDWTIKIDHKTYPASSENIEKYVLLTANDYKRSKEKDLNEWRQIAGLKSESSHEYDEEILALQRQARII